MTNDEARALIAEAKSDAPMLAAFREFGDSYLIRTKHGAYGTCAVVKALERELALADGYAEALDDVASAEQNMLCVLDGTFSVGDGTAQREIERCRARIATLESGLRDALGNWNLSARSRLEKLLADGATKETT